MTLQHLNLIYFGRFLCLNRCQSGDGWLTFHNFSQAHMKVVETEREGEKQCVCACVRVKL